MAYSDDHIALAAEYALGTLDADERALVETMMIVDPGFLEMVEAWDRKLSPLHEMVAPVEPPTDLWERIKAVTTHSKERAVTAPPTPSVAEPEAPPPTEPTRFEGAPEPVVDVRPVPQDATEEVEDKVVELKPVVVRSRGGRVFGTFMTAVAACLAAIVSLQIYRPDLLPQQLRGKPQSQPVERPATPPSSAQFVAVIQSNAAVPAFILTVDTASRSFTVRRVGVPPAQDKSYELWIVSKEIGPPRSLGVIDDSNFTTSKTLASYDPAVVNGAIYAVTVEQKGGSPSGSPTVQPLWAGKLFESVPAQPPKP